MAIKREDIEYISRLARINISEELFEILYKDLRRILEYIDILQEVDIQNIPPTTHILEVSNVFREDKPQESLDREKILRFSPQREKGFFKVPRVIE